MSVLSEVHDAGAWVDCFQDFKQCVAKLAPGAVVTAPDVRLQDIISAVEMLDPRTDFNCDFDKILTLDDLCATHTVPTPEVITATFTEDDYVGVCEILWVRLYQWLEGRTLPQTLGSCVYMHDLKKIESVKVLHAFMSGMLKFVGYSIEIIGRADVREEDEFPIYSFNIDLLPELTIEALLDSLSQAQTYCNDKGWNRLLSHIRLCSSMVTLASHLEAGNKNLEVSMEPILLSATEALNKVEEYVSKTSTPSEAICRAQRAAATSIFHEATTRWVSAMTPLSYLSHKEGTETPSSFINIILAYYQKLVHDMQEITQGISFFSDDVTEMLTFVLDFSARAPCLLVRSWLMTLAYNGDTQVLFDRGTISDLLLRTFSKRHGCPTLELMVKGDEPTLKTVTRYRVQKLRELKKYCSDFTPPDTSNETQLLEITRQQVIDFMYRLGRFVLHALFSVLNNRARYRRRLANIFSELALLQKLAWEMDVNIFCGGFSCLEHYFTSDSRASHIETCEQCQAAQQAIILSAFVVDLVARCMLDYMLLGIELELYAVEELPSAYCYAENILSVFGENYSVLYKPKDMLVRNSLRHKKTTQRLFPPVVNARELCFPSQSTIHRHDLLRLLLAGTERVHQILIRVELLSVTGVRSLNSLQNKYTHRYGVFEDLLRPSMFRFDACQRHISTVAIGDLDHVVTSTMQVFEHITSRYEDMKRVLNPTTERLCRRWVQAAKANLVCLRVVKTLMSGQGLADYVAVAEYTLGWVTYKLVRKSTENLKKV